jgi:glycosyltransferase involved in cell wall biosynthesis
MPIELLGVSQMETCFLNTQDQKNRVLEEAKLWFNDLFIQKLNDIFVVWNLGVDNSKIIETPQPKKNIIVFNHRAAAYKGYPAFIKLMEEYREKRQDFIVWVPQLDGKPEHSWIDNTKVTKHDYYKKLQSCTVGVQMRQTNYGWSVAATDCMMNGTPMIYQESDCYREIEPDGMFFKFKKDLFETLDKLLDNNEFRLEQSIKSIERAKELSLNDGKMIKLLNEKLRA